jgi:hypothetical protein
MMSPANRAMFVRNEGWWWWWWWWGSARFETDQKTHLFAQAIDGVISIH